MMLDYAKYLLSPVLLLVSIYGLADGGAMVWLGLGVLLTILSFDAFFKPDHSMRDQRFPWLYDTIVGTQIVGGFVLILLYCYWVGAGHFTSKAEHIGAFLTMIFTQFVLISPALHEMFHRENTLLRWIGRLGMVMLFDPWREITHVVTHHLQTVTPYDPDYARRGQNLYGHLVSSFKEQAIESFHLERKVWMKRGRNWYDVRNPWVWRVGILVAFATLLTVIGGVWGMILSIAVCLLGPRVFLEVFNYTQHYGLVTGTPGRFERRHTWNHLTPFVRVLALEITNHAGHHEDSYKPFYKLEPDVSGPKQPPFLLCLLMAFVPPIWFAMIRPLLADWDRDYANLQEREIAHAENIRAGWSDLNADPGLAESRYAFAI